MTEMEGWAVRLKDFETGKDVVAWVNFHKDTAQRLCHDYYDGVIDERKGKYEIIPCKVVFESERKC